MKSIKVLLLVVFVLILACINPSTAAVPVANFTGTPTTGPAPLSVSFTDQSTGSPAGWAWYFGDEAYTAPWTQMTASAGWSPRYTFSSVAMPDGSIVMMGGYDWSYKNDVWRSTDKGATWTQMTASAGWSARWAQSSVVMPDSSIVMMGGGDSGGQKNDVWRSTDKGATWTQVTANAWLVGRGGQSSVVMPDSSIVMMGGGDSGGLKNDVWRSTDKGATWTQVTASAGWSPRAYHISVVMPDSSIVLMGGESNIIAKDDVWRSTDYGTTWTEVNASAGWSPIWGFNGVVMPDGSIVLMGGEKEGVYGIYYNEIWRSTDEGATWARLPNAGWTGRVGLSSVALPDGSIVLMGGWDGIPNLKNDVWRLVPTGSSAQNPSHTYSKPGIYPVALQVYNSAGYDSLLKMGYISVNAPTTNVPINVKIVPKTINLGSKGYFLAFVTLPDAYKGATIDMKTVSCSGAPAVRMMKLKFFPRMVGFVFKTSALNNVEVGKRVTLTVKGEMKNKGTTYTFTGSDDVKVISKPSWQPDDIKDISKESDDQLFKKFNM